MSCSSHFETLQVHAGSCADPITGSCATPIHQTVAFEFKSVEHGAALFELKEEGYIYTRLHNPTISVFEKRIAALEGGTAAVATASGQSASFLTIQNLAEAGDNIVCSSSLYGGSVSLFNNSFRSLGIDFRFAKGREIVDYEGLIDSHTKALFVETIGNSDFYVPDFEKLVDLGNKYGIPLIVDNTFAGGGYIFKPISYGVAIVTHAATKWIGGHGNSLAGIVIDGGNFDWNSSKFPQFSEPCAAYHNTIFAEQFGNSAFAARARLVGLRDWGCCLSPMNAFLLLQGVETLSLRMQRAMDNSLELAQWLSNHPKVEKVNYPGLKNNPNYENANRYFKNGFGAVLSVEVKGDKAQTSAFVNRLELIADMTNVGDNKTIITHSASTTHGQLSDQELKAAGISPGALRIAVGIEHIDDLKADLSQALETL